MNGLKQEIDLQNEYLCTYLRDQIDKLGSVLRHLNLNDIYDKEGILQKLNSVEGGLSNIRKFLQS